jgi:2-desacetyl-2-hydroxyethyl bacteriochlorophyllide A dehydrogenase
MKDVEAPSAQAGEALVRIKRIGICGTDLHAYKGRQPFFTYPRVLGHELSGEIESVGENDAGLKAGDAVVVVPYLPCGGCIACRQGKTNCCTALSLFGVHQDGGMCEVLSVPTANLIKAEGLKLEQMAIVECLAIGAHAVRRAQITPGSFALVIGGGPIGMGAMQFARIAGAKVIAMDINAERLAYCRETLGADHTVDATGDVDGQLQEITGGEYASTVFDCTGNPQSMMNAFAYVAHAGTYVLVSLVKADITFNDPEFHKRETTLLSSRNATREDLEQVVEAMQAGQVETETFITHRCGFDDMIGQFDSWLEPETGVIKAVVEL